jgi:hypothetical protein
VAAPLLEEKRDPGLDALMLDRFDPPRVDRARPVTGFSADDHPVDPIEV